MGMIKLSVICLTYNHAEFIRQALEGFVMQQTDFPFEVIVHDDASTDGTADIIREYANKYPKIIRPVFQVQNQWSQGCSIVKKFIAPLVRGEYVALCEGDDYWTNPLKLQKQADFLEANPDYSLCFHPVVVHWDDRRERDSRYPGENQVRKFDFKTLLKQNFIATNSVLYRWRFRRDDVSLIADGVLPGDWFLHLLHAQVGKIGFLPEVMAVYRRHQGGIWTGSGKDDTWFVRCGLANIKFNEAVERQFGISRQKEIKKMCVQTFCAAVRQKNGQLIEVLQDAYSHVLQQIVAEPLVCQRKYFYSLLYKIPLNICRKKAERKIRQLDMVETIKNFYDDPANRGLSN